MIGTFLNQSSLLDRFGVLICYSKVEVRYWVSSWEEIWDTVPRGQKRDAGHKVVLGLQGILHGMRGIHVPGQQNRRAGSQVTLGEVH